MRRALSIGVACAISALSACDKGASGGAPSATADAPASTGKATAAATASAASAASTSATAAPPPATASAAPSASSDASAAPTATAAPASTLMPTVQTGAFPDGESKPPSVKEWDEQAAYFPVKFASSLWCETRTIREWVRVSCRVKTGASNTPTDVQATKKPGRGQFYVFTRKESVTSVVLQPRVGHTSEYAFTWSNWGTRTLKVSWPQGAQKPTLEFDKGGPTSKDGLPKCEDVCPVGTLYHQMMSDCKYGCGDGYRCDWFSDGGQRTAMCMCLHECGY
jgi:hypothetical protein